LISSFRRFKALLVREYRQTFRTRGSIAIVFAGPALLLILFAYSVSLDIERVPVAIAIEQSTPEARDLAGAFYNARYFRPVFFEGRHAAEGALAEGDVSGVIVLAGDFARAALGGDQAPVQILVDGVDPRISRIVASYTESAVANWLAQRALVGRASGVDAVRTRSRVWFNAELESRYFLMPGLIVLLMTVVGPLLTALVIVREWESGTMEAMLATPMTSGDFIVAKVAWYLTLGLAAVMLMVGLTVHVTGVPFRGSILPIVLAGVLFMLCAVGLGAVISMAARAKVAATRLTLTTGYLPAYMLSGVLFDLRSAPEPIQWVSHLVPARYFVSILHTVMLAGDMWAVILPDLAGLALIALALLGCAAILIRKRLS
jgi:ABC-2 type transport system permease protein